MLLIIGSGNDVLLDDQSCGGVDYSLRVVAEAAVLEDHGRLFGRILTPVWVGIGDGTIDPLLELFAVLQLFAQTSRFRLILLRLVLLFDQTLDLTAPLADTLTTTLQVILAADRMGRSAGVDLRAVHRMQVQPDQPEILSHLDAVLEQLSDRLLILRPEPPQRVVIRLSCPASQIIGSHSRQARSTAREE